MRTLVTGLLNSKDVGTSMGKTVKHVRRKILKSVDVDNATNMLQDTSYRYSQDSRIPGATAFW